MAVGLLTYQLIILIALKYTFKDFCVWFVILEFIFYFGRVFVKAVGEDYEMAWRLFERFSENSSYRAALFVLCTNMAIFMGMMITDNDKTVAQKEKETKKYSENCLWVMGIGILCLTFPIKVYCNIQNIIAQTLAGTYTSAGDYNGVLAALSWAPVYGLLLILSSKKMTQSRFKIIYTIYVIYDLVYMTFSGDRRQEAIGIVVMMIAYFEVYKIKVSYGSWIRLAIAGILGLYVLATIRSGRMDVFTSTELFFQSLKQMVENNIVIETLGEFGVTFFSVASVIEYIPDYFDFFYGKTVISTFIILFPGICTWLFPDWTITLEDQCLSIHNQALGGSIFQDLYGNFGLYGILVAVLVGVLIGKIFSKSNKMTSIGLAKYYLLFYVLINLIRAGLPEIGRSLVYALIIGEAIGWVYRNTRLKRVYHVKL